MFEAPNHQLYITFRSKANALKVRDGLKKKLNDAEKRGRALQLKYKRCKDNKIRIEDGIASMKRDVDSSEVDRENRANDVKTIDARLSAIDDEISRSMVDESALNARGRTLLKTCKQQVRHSASQIVTSSASPSSHFLPSPWLLLTCCSSVHHCVWIHPHDRAHSSNTLHTHTTFPFQDRDSIGPMNDKLKLLEDSVRCVFHNISSMSKDHFALPF